MVWILINIGALKSLEFQGWKDNLPKHIIHNNPYSCSSSGGVVLAPTENPQNGFNWHESQSSVFYRHKNGISSKQLL